MIFIYKRNKNYRLNSVLISKIKHFKQQFKKFNIIFLMKNQKKDPIIFFFLILYLFSGKAPQMLTKRLKKKKKFLGFRLYFRDNFFQEFIFNYFSILDNISILKRKSNLGHNFLVIEEFPVIHEIDLLCEKYNPLLDFIKNYKLILYLKIFNFNTWYDSECMLRILKFPYKNKNRL